MMGHIHANIGAVVDGNEDYEDEDSWEDNVLADLGVEFLQISGETEDSSHQDQGVILSNKED